MVNDKLIYFQHSVMIAIVLMFAVAGPRPVSADGHEMSADGTAATSASEMTSTANPDSDADTDTADDLLDDLAGLLDSKVASGETGSFGYRLQKYNVQPYVHGYAVVDSIYEQKKPYTFDLHYFNVFVGANIADIVIPEVQLEYEHGGDEIQVRFGQFDVKAKGDQLVFRVGKFLVPFGSFNEFLYPEFISKLPDRPFALRNIVPVSWAEVGAQVRGKYDLEDEKTLNYAMYVVNGLEQDDDTATSGTDDGGDIRSMRNNHRDKNHGNKAVGGRLGMKIADVGFGLSGYTGKYTEDGLKNLSIVGADFRFENEGWTMETEYVAAFQQASAGDLLKHGGYVLGAYRVNSWIEPVLQFDLIELDAAATSDKWRATAGINYYPLPDSVVNLIVKSSFAHTQNGGTDVDDDRFIIQAAVGF